MDYYAEYKLSCYKQLEKLYGNKEVYLVRNQEDGLLYIFKYVDKRMKSLYQALQKVEDVHLPQIKEIIELDNKIAVVEENINGINLEDYIEVKGTFSRNEVCKIGRALCKTLEKLHQQEPPIIHRDIKPANIMIDQLGNVYLIDFNVAKEYSEGKKEDTVLMGTKDFAAPEQYGFRQSDVRTDVYGLGATLNYMLTGTILKEKIATGEFRHIIERCTRLEPNTRYQSMRELHNAIQRIPIHENVDTEKETILEGTIETVRGEVIKENTFSSNFTMLKLVKMMGFLMYNLFFIMVALGLTVTNEQGKNVTGMELTLNKTFFLLAALGMEFLWFNIGNVKRHLPFMDRGIIIQLLAVVLYSVLWVFSVVAILVLVEGIVF